MGLDEKEAGGPQVHRHLAVEGGHTPGQGPEDAGGGGLAEPGGVHARKDLGDDSQGWWHDHILN